MHEVLVNRLGGLSLPRKSVVRLTDRPDMTLDVYRGCKTTTTITEKHRYGILFGCHAFQSVAYKLVSEINFFCGYQLPSSCYLVFKVVTKLTYLVAILGGHVTAWLPPIIRFMTKQNSMVDNAFDQLELCLCYKGKS